MGPPCLAAADAAHNHPIRLGRRFAHTLDEEDGLVVCVEQVLERAHVHLSKRAVSVDVQVLCEFNSFDRFEFKYVIEEGDGGTQANDTLLK